jgi:integrase
VRAAKLPKGKDHLEVYDTVCPGLVLRVSAAAKTWMFYFRHDGKFQKLTLGNALAIKLTDARKHVNEMAERVRAGSNPRVAAIDAPVTFAELAERFLAGSSRVTKADDQAMLRVHVIPAVGAKRLLALSGPDFSRMKEQILANARRVEAETAARLNRAPRQRAGERIADRVIGLCKTILRYGVPLGYVSSDYTIGIRRSKKATDARTRILDDAEIVSFLRALPAIFPDEQRQIMMRLILLLGCRKGEILGAHVNEFRLAAMDRGIATPEWHQPKERVKNRHSHVVPLCTEAVALVERAKELAGQNAAYLFPSPKTVRANRCAQGPAARIPSRLHPSPR